MYKHKYKIIVILLIMNNVLYSQWTNIYTSSPSYLDSFSPMYFVNASTGYITKRDSAVIKTVNGGLNWASVPGTAGYDLQDIQFTSINVGYAIGSNFTNNVGYILKTTNSGDNWNVYQIPGIKVHRVKFIDSNIGFVLADSNYVFKTTNGGINWSSQSLSTGYLIDFDFIDVNTGFATGGFQRFYKTTNGGDNWSNNSLGAPFANIDFVNALTGYLTSNFNNGEIYKTTDGGNSAVQIFTIDSVSVGRPFFIDSNTGWIPASRNRNFVLNRVILKTINGGLNWFEQSSGMQSDSSSCVSSIFMLDANTGFAATSYCSSGGPSLNPKVFKTTNGGSPIGIINNSEIIKSYKLNQNYPNPFNPSTVISYALPKRSFVIIKIYDIIGSVIMLLTSNYQNAGNHEITFDGKNLPSGIYYYELITNDFKETKKMALIK